MKDQENNIAIIYIKNLLHYLNNNHYIISIDEIDLNEEYLQKYG